MDKINGKQLKEMLESGCNNLNNRKKEVDALNVFPVPDGDTGTNMSLTFTNGISEVRKSGSEDLPTVAKTLSRGLLMGARGNSGVITSQIFRGFYQAIGDKTELTAADFSACMNNGSKMAYKAVMRPVEGTILTVVRESCEASSKFMEANPQASLEEYVTVLCEEAQKSLDHTPELLPILKEARVVDSGGSGLVSIFEGFKAYLDGNPIQEAGADTSKTSDEVRVGYRVEFILSLAEQGMHLFKESKFRDKLAGIGDHVTVVVDEDCVKTRVSTLSPGEALNIGQRYGEFRQIQIDPESGDMKPSILETEKAAKEQEYGIITVCAGEGLEKLFRDYRADYVVSGGQTMNPSTEDFVEAIAKVNARHVFILPNNSNIIMAARQAADVTEGKDIIVLETKTIPQGLAACIQFNPEADVKSNTDVMNEAIRSVKTGQITYSIKDTTIEGREIHEGDYMGLLNREIVLTSRDKLDATCQLLDQMIDEDSGIVTLIRGADTTEEEIERVNIYIEKHFEVDVEIQNGGQPVYSFIIGVE